MMNLKWFGVSLTAIGLIMWYTTAYSLSANEVWFEFLANGRFRVKVNYTLPELKEFREAYVDFNSQKAAEAFYWHLVRGGDFHLKDPKTDHFHQVPQQPSPW